MIGELTNHLWQSTLFASLAGLLTLALRKNRAQIRYWLWFSASLKFFLPFSLLVDLGGRLQWALPAKKIAAPVLFNVASFTMEQIARPFPSAVSSARSTPGAAHWVLTAILGVWACGFVAIALIRLRGWRRIRAAVRSSAPIEIPGFDTPPGVEVRCSPGLLEPGVVGLGLGQWSKWSHAILLLPTGITDRLTPPQLEAVLAHELCHVRRCDNLFASIHMIAEAIFWFHPLVWWIGARLVEERERACDEEVLSLVGEPRVYAEGILNVCKLYVESPLVCVSGVTGANLKRRIEAIMTNRTGQRLNRAKKFLLACAGVAVLAVPVAVGIGNAPPVRAQSPTATGAQFDVASIKPNNSGGTNVSVRLGFGGRVRAVNSTLRLLITTAYSLPDLRLSGGPAWADSARFDIDARGQGKNPDETLAMLQTLLADRFQLKVHWETKELPIYALLVAKNGSKLDPPRGTGCFDPLSLAGSPPPEPNPGEGPVRPCGGFNGSFPGQLYGAKVPMWRFAMNLTRILGRAVVNKTGLDGPYDITLRWNPNEFQPAAEPQSADDSAPSIFTAVQEQLGLRLESQKGPVEILVIDRAERPSEN